MNYVNLTQRERYSMGYMPAVCHRAVSRIVRPTSLQEQARAPATDESNDR